MHIRHPLSVPPAAVWKELSDFGGIARWSPDLAMSTQIARRGVAIGAVRELTFARPQAGVRTIRERITECGDMWFSYVLDGGIGAYGSAGSTWRVIATDDGCIVEVTSHLEDGPWWARLMWPITYVRLQRGVVRALNGLERRLKA